VQHVERQDGVVEVGAEAPHGGHPARCRRPPGPRDAAAGQSQDGDHPQQAVEDLEQAERHGEWLHAGERVAAGARGREHRPAGHKQQPAERHGGSPLAPERLADPLVGDGQEAVDKEQRIAALVPAAVADLAAQRDLHGRKRHRQQQDATGSGQQPGQPLDRPLSPGLLQPPEAGKEDQREPQQADQEPEVARLEQAAGGCLQQEGEVERGSQVPESPIEVGRGAGVAGSAQAQIDLQRDQGEQPDHQRYAQPPEPFARERGRAA
jgi:hypothetical protein